MAAPKSIDVFCDHMLYLYAIKKEAVESGLTEEEIRKGLWPAVEEFLIEHPEWKLKERYTHNNGLTILQRV